MGIQRKFMKHTLNSKVSEIAVSYKTSVKPSEQFKITCCEEANKVFREIWSDDMELREEFYMLLLNRNNRVIGWYRVSQGGLNETSVDPKLIFSIALKCLASSIIVAHNHPSGTLTPSTSDKDITERLTLGAKILGMQLLDHLILTKDSYYSIRESETA